MMICARTSINDMGQRARHWTTGGLGGVGALIQCLRHICECELVWHAIWNTNAVGTGCLMVQGGSMQLQRRLARLTRCNAWTFDERALADCCLMEFLKVLRRVFCVVGVLDDRLFVDQALGIPCHTFRAKTIPYQLVNAHDAPVELAGCPHISSMTLVPGGMGQVSCTTIDAHASLFVDKRGVPR